ncbi:DUF3618 domain-containing protein [Pacificimonas sp. WHA3]|uniref:DUF3618 domain-containing protein n=1 Tax=Pacificimonas pallii TaxID=2827236 RepID=A0ABS6SE75_9SPHN|nr:DUF3618 domain-containing protein [Pacificimonas pallii]MBV7256560.1 DUF3618 domain-containing protein [Pacificimonas pallii]
MKVDPHEKIAVNAAEANHARARIAEIIDRMHTRLSPERLIDDAATAAKAHAARNVEAARSTLQRHPVAVGFFGAVIGLIAARRLANDK